MENNWKEKAKEIAERNIEDCFEIENITRAMLEFGNLVFESTKEECADKADTKRECNFLGEEWIIDKDSILNINKPNL